MSFFLISLAVMAKTIISRPRQKVDVLVLNQDQDIKTNTETKSKTSAHKNKTKTCLKIVSRQDTVSRPNISGARPTVWKFNMKFHTFEHQITLLLTEHKNLLLTLWAGYIGSQPSRQGHKLKQTMIDPSSPLHIKH